MSILKKCCAVFLGLCMLSMAASAAERWEYDCGFLAAAPYMLRHSKHPVTVAVIDTGLDPTAAIFENRVRPGYNFVTDCQDVTDYEGHGTQVAGLVLMGAQKAPVEILPLKVYDDAAGAVSMEAVLGACRYAILQQVDVINLSISDRVDVTDFRAVLEEADRAGIIVVAPSGNSGDGQLLYPAAYETTISVASGDGAYATINRYTDTYAPGNGVKAPTLGGGMNYVFGSSFSAAIASSAAAVAKSIWPEMNRAAFAACLGEEINMMEIIWNGQNRSI